MSKYSLIVFLIVILNACYITDNTSQIDENNDVTDSIGSVEQELVFSATKKDSSVFGRLIYYAKAYKLAEKTIAEIEIEITKQFLNTPYVGGTLEQDGEEQLVVNLRELDCVTLIENVVAISKCIKSGTTSFIDYCRMLKRIRYRDGIIDGYPSRLHYTTDWLLNNEKKGIVKVVSNKFGNADFNSAVYFMSKNAGKYKKMAGNKDFVNKIKHYEKRISAAKLKFITKDKIDALENNIKDGDIIGFATNIEGLDISHVAIAKYKDNRLHFYHASSAKKKVVLSELPVSEYCSKKWIDGILVTRLVE